MNDWIWFGLAAFVLIAVFGGTVWLLRQSQKIDPMDRGKDSSTPGDFYTDQGG